MPSLSCPADVIRPDAGSRGKTMDAARWERVQELFHDAAALPDSERLAFLQSACGDDPSLVNDTLSLLAEDALGGSVLDRGVASVAEKVLGREVPFSPSTQQFRSEEHTSE